jgi:Cys-tRNA(Pro)/Cys-tRNA(Cys) deacylase
MAASPKTNAARLLDAAGIEYELRTYDLTMEDFSASAVAEQIGLPASEVFKTLIAEVDGIGPCFAIVPGDAELDLKALAKAVGGRRAAMAALRDVQRLTGYARGAVTVLGAKKSFPAIIDESVLGLATLAVSAGARSLQLVLRVDDYMAATGAIAAPIAR